MGQKKLFSVGAYGPVRVVVVLPCSSFHSSVAAAVVVVAAACNDGAEVVECTFVVVAVGN